jgi:hypothetical protein
VHLADTQPQAFRDMSGLEEYPAARPSRLQRSKHR